MSTDKQQASNDNPQQMPTPDQLKVVDSKQFGLTGMQKEVLQNFLSIQQLNQFQLRAHLQLMAEQSWGIKADQFVRFGLNLEQNQVTVEFLEPKKADEKAASNDVEAAPPAPAS